MQGLFAKRKANVLKSLVLQRNVKGEGLVLYLSDTRLQQGASWTLAEMANEPCYLEFIKEENVIYCHFWV